MTIDIKTTDATFRSICQFALKHYPEEACGFIVQKGKKAVVIDCKNVAENRINEFLIDPVDQARAYEEGEIIASWHTHTNGTNEPSEFDRVGCNNCELPYVIVGLRKDDADEFVFTAPNVLLPDDTVLDYVGRPYMYGVMDCYSLVVDYYDREFDIKLDFMPQNRIPFFWEEGMPLMEDSFDHLGFVRLGTGSIPEVGDLFVMQCGSKVANHVAIYIGDDKILHHSHNRLSCRVPYSGGYWQHHTVHHLRHKDKMK